MLGLMRSVVPNPEPGAGPDAPATVVKPRPAGETLADVLGRHTTIGKLWLAEGDRIRCVACGHRCLTFGMMGCDFHCSYCQNWVTSQALRDEAARAPIQPVTPEQLVATGRRL